MELQIVFVEGEKRIEACMANPFYNSYFESLDKTLWAGFIGIRIL